MPNATAAIGGKGQVHAPPLVVPDRIIDKQTRVQKAIQIPLIKLLNSFRSTLVFWARSRNSNCSFVAT